MRRGGDRERGDCERHSKNWVSPSGTASLRKSFISLFCDYAGTSGSINTYAMISF